MEDTYLSFATVLQGFSLRLRARLSWVEPIEGIQDAHKVNFFDSQQG
jgi:hypothetical protein